MINIAVKISGEWLKASEIGKSMIDNFSTRELKLIGRRLQWHLKREAPMGETGGLKSGIRVIKASKNILAIDMPYYGMMVQQGTKERNAFIPIYPVKKRALWGSTLSHPIGKAMHPGIDANHFISRALGTVERLIPNYMKEAARRTIKDRTVKI